MRLTNVQPWRRGLAATVAATIGLGLGAGAAYADSPGPEWKLHSSETIRAFEPGKTPPTGGKPASPAEAKALNDAASGKVSHEWQLFDTKTIRFFQAGGGAPQGGVPATEAQKAEMLRPADSYWKLVDEQKHRYFVAGANAPEGVQVSNRPASDPFAGGGWRLVTTDQVRFFAPFPTGLENPYPPMPKNPAPEVILEGISMYPALATKEFVGDVRRDRLGLLIRSWQHQIERTPRTQKETTIYRAYSTESYMAPEPRTFSISHGGYSELVPYTAQVKNYRWVLKETDRKSRELPYADHIRQLGEKIIATTRSNEVGALADANTTRPGTFQGDSGSGGKATLTAAKQRETMGANEVKPSNIVLTAAQIEEARQKAEEENRKRLEEEARQRDEEEARRKAERDELARRALEEAADVSLPVIKNDWMAWFRKGNDAVRFQADGIVVYKREKGVWKTVVKGAYSGSFSKDHSTYTDPVGPEFLTKTPITLHKSKSDEYSLKGEFGGTFGTNKQQTLKVDGFKKKGAPDLSPPKVSTYKVDAVLNTVDESDLKKSAGINKSVAGPTLAKGKLYEVTATGTAKYTLTKSEHWFTPNDSSATRFKALLVKDNSVKKVVDYVPGQGFTFLGDDYAGHTLRFVFEDEFTVDNVLGSGFNLTLTESPFDPEED